MTTDLIAAKEAIQQGPSLRTSALPLRKPSAIDRLDVSFALRTSLAGEQH